MPFCKWLTDAMFTEQAFRRREAIEKISNLAFEVTTQQDGVDPQKDIR